MQTTFEQFVQMTAFVHANNKNFEKMYAKFNLDEGQWQEITGHWMKQIAADSDMGARFQTMMLSEIERLKSAAPAATV